MQCYPQPFQVEKNLNQNSMPKKKKSIIYNRKMKALCDRQELRKFTTHSLYMKKRNFSREF